MSSLENGIRPDRNGVRQNPLATSWASLIIIAWIITDVRRQADCGLLQDSDSIQPDLNVTVIVGLDLSGHRRADYHDGQDA